MSQSLAPPCICRTWFGFVNRRIHLLVALAGVLFVLSSTCSGQSALSLQQERGIGGSVDTLAGGEACDAVVGASTVHVEYGKRRPVIDSIGCLWGSPDKLLLWDRRAKNHHVTEPTVSEVVAYLDQRKLHDVRVRVNQYDPCGEWRRLMDNGRVGAPWRYTVGVLKHLKYTLLPGRVFGRDDYNPFTNTLSLYSDMPALGLAEAAYAKDIDSRRYPGTFATAQMIPPIGIWHETLATDEALYYVSVHGSRETESEIRRDLYARFGLKLGKEVSAVLPDGSCVYQIIGAFSGHTLATLQHFVEQR